MKTADDPVGLGRNSRENLERILDEMIEQPEALEALNSKIDTEFGEVRAVLVLDMSGFSRTTQKRGITAFLLMIHQMKRLSRPAIAQGGGILVKGEADNLYCLFPDVPDAIAAARQIMTRLETVNLLLPEDRQLYASIGIGYGRILNVEALDMFGDEVNLASKLGEDIAQQGMILLSPAARERASETGIETREETASISGLTFNYYSLA